MKGTIVRDGVKSVLVRDNTVATVLSYSWTPSGGKATVVVTFNTAVYCGVDIGQVAGTYTQSALSYTSNNPNNAGGPLFSTTHTFTVPEQWLGTETLAAGTWYSRVAAGITMLLVQYVQAEQTGTI